MRAVRSRRSRPAHGGRATLGARFSTLLSTPMAGLTATSPHADRNHRAPAVARARSGVLGRRAVPHSLRADAGLQPLGRGDGPWPRTGDAADRQARRADHRARARRPLCDPAAVFRWARQRACSPGTICTASARAKPSCGCSTRCACKPPAPAATRPCRPGPQSRAMPAAHTDETKPYEAAPISATRPSTSARRPAACAASSTPWPPSTTS